MYLPDGTELMTDAQDCAVKHAQESLARQLCIQTKFAQGRAAVYQSILSPDQIAEQFGIPAGVSAASLQQQTQPSRASAFLYGSGAADTGVAQVMIDTPQVFPVGRAASCSPGALAKPKYKKVTPGFPRKAPDIVRTSDGPMYFEGKASTVAPSSQMGLTGYAPPWGNAYATPTPGSAEGGVLGWIQANPLLSFAIAGFGLAVASTQKRGRR